MNPMLRRAIFFSTALQGIWFRRHFYLSDSSFNDPNLLYILSRIRVLFGENLIGNTYRSLRRVQRGFQESQRFSLRSR